MDIKDGTDSLKTGVGAIFTVFLFMVVLIYTYLRFDVFYNKQKMEILMTTEQQYLNDSFEFKTKNGFTIATMFTAYDDNPNPILDPTYGELLIRYTRWGENPDGTFYDEFIDLPTHYCTP